ncbi:hypothetical protein ASPBRDRAFT_498317 [Aspergillus brasiliensis CBS 101740]|uniref:Uncharacterized protein n=1 Tax=Aspergillus brasiliensis (strain CBS 101740 / IMI 381727 / IBT 21946) TaxID=767769 RepID=A0A1L9UNF2_ASPBC|nr:hypothetical protein ASPBRDRAFT_498317 [Aspergillus brasiliensis CBS 101740]
MSLGLFISNSYVPSSGPIDARGHPANGCEANSRAQGISLRYDECNPQGTISNLGCMCYSIVVNNRQSHCKVSMERCWNSAPLTQLIEG